SEINRTTDILLGDKGIFGSWKYYSLSNSQL
ncbi:MAG: hypothetical protein ACI9TV_003120, partial [Sulfurimonas sp.]